MVLNQPLHFRALNLEELKRYLKSLDVPAYRASQILHWLHKQHAAELSEMKNLPPSLRDRLAREGKASVLQLVEVPKSGDQGSLKYLMKTEDGHLLETVLIVQSGRRTVCVSTQLGCRIRCSFCASGKGQFVRHLTAGEIVEQVSVICRHQKDSVTNVVFMGIGEPLDNYEATMKALEILMAEWGFGLGGRRITVSTSGVTPKIEEFVHDSRGRVRLSVSLHSSDQELRSRLVPIGKKYRLDELMRSLEHLKKTLKREITFEYTLIKGVNDSEKEARGVAKLAARLNAKVNLIPYNPIREMNFERPNSDELDRFRKLLEAKHIRVTVRQTAGRDIDAACGQLRLDRM